MHRLGECAIRLIVLQLKISCPVADEIYIPIHTFPTKGHSKPIRAVLLCAAQKGSEVQAYLEKIEKEGHFSLVSIHEMF